MWERLALWLLSCPRGMWGSGNFSKHRFLSPGIVYNPVETTHTVKIVFLTYRIRLPLWPAQHLVGFVIVLEFFGGGVPIDFSVELHYDMVDQAC